MRRLVLMTLVGGPVLFAIPSCHRGADTEAARVAAELARCRETTQTLQQTVDNLKGKLTEALARPQTIAVEPLTIAGNIKATPQEGTLAEKAVVTAVRRGRDALQGCYNRALKRNSNLHHRSLTVALSFLVEATGQPTEVSIRPSYDAEMTDCIRRVIASWRFPAFSGEPVGVETQVTLTPTAS